MDDILKNETFCFNFGDIQYLGGIYILNRRELNKLFGKVKQDGYSLIPISLYFKGNFVKVELGLGKGKKLYDKRQDIAKKDAQRRIQKALRANEKSI